MSVSIYQIFLLNKSYLSNDLISNSYTNFKAAGGNGLRRLTTDGRSGMFKVKALSDRHFISGGANPNIALIDFTVRCTAYDDAV